MRDSARILGPSAGVLDARIMFVGEAPGRLGADGSGIPFHGDKAGDNFEDLIEFVGISRADIFVTNAVLCNPKDHYGNNATPNSSEIKNCSRFLDEQIQLVNPELVVSLGAKALEALGIVEPHSLTLKRDVRTANKWNGRVLIPLYHPGQRAMIHRSMANQRSDYQFVAEMTRSYPKKRRASASATNVDVASVVYTILEEIGPITYFALHKILYLVEYQFIKNVGERLSPAYFIRQKDGPYCTDIQVRRICRRMDNLVVERRNADLILRLRPDDLFRCNEKVDANLKDQNCDKLVRKIVERYKGLSNAQLKHRAYMTTPMRVMLRAEKHYKSNLYNAPVDIDLVRK